MLGTQDEIVKLPSKSRHRARRSEFRSLLELSDGAFPGDRLAGPLQAGVTF